MSPWVVMWLLSVVVFAACKFVTWRFTPTPPAPRWRHLAYLFLWPGLDARAFLDTTPLSREKRAGFGEWLFAGAKTTFGAVLLWLAAPLVGHEYARAWVGMAGIVFLLHFGSFHLLSCAWRAVGIDAKPLMNWPVLSQSVSEFWGKRWNLAFRDITHRFLFRPVTKRINATWGLAAVFVFSGLVHDAVISLPPLSGFGFPTLYFVIQGLALLVERTRFAKKVGLGAGWRGRLFTAVVTVGPACGLFHPPFARDVVLPFMAAIGAS